MIRLLAPYATPMTLTLLKNPNLSNEESLDVLVDHRKMMDGTRFSYVNTSSDRRLNWSWTNVDRGKMLEVLEFIYSYLGQEIMIVDWREDVWRGRILTQPFELETNIKHVPCGEARGEGGDFRIEFLARKITNMALGPCDAPELAQAIMLIQLAEAQVVNLDIEVNQNLIFNDLGEGEIDEGEVN